MSSDKNLTRGGRLASCVVKFADCVNLAGTGAIALPLVATVTPQGIKSFDEVAMWLGAVGLFMWLAIAIVWRAWQMDILLRLGLLIACSSMILLWRGWMGIGS